LRFIDCAGDVIVRHPMNSCPSFLLPITALLAFTFTAEFCSGSHLIVATEKVDAFLRTTPVKVFQPV